MENSDFDEPSRKEAGQAVLPASFLVVTIGRQDYALDLRRVKEIIGMMVPMTIFEDSTDCLVGLINLYCRVVPVLDLAFELGCQAVGYDHQSSIVVIESSGRATEIQEAGILVNKIRQVRPIAPSAIRRTVESLEKLYIQGTVPGKKGDIKVLSPDFLSKIVSLPDDLYDRSPFKAKTWSNLKKWPHR